MQMHTTKKNNLFFQYFNKYTIMKCFIFAEDFDILNNIDLFNSTERKIAFLVSCVFVKLGWLLYFIIDLI